MASLAFPMTTTLIRPSKVAAQFYGYFACLLALGILCAGIHLVINAGFEIAGASITQARDANDFDQFKMGYFSDRMEYLKRMQEEQDHAASAGVSSANLQRIPPMAIPGDSELRRMYDDRQKLDAERSHFYNERNLYTSLELVVMGLVVFGLHWRWLRRLARNESEMPALI